MIKPELVELKCKRCGMTIQAVKGATLFYCPCKNKVVKKGSKKNG